MIDPITALATATSAFNLIKKGFEVGRDVESMGSDLGRWMGAMSDQKKAEDMRDELKKLISWTRGPSAWDELLRMEAEIRKKRQQAIYDQQERQRKLFEGVAIVVLIGICAAVLSGGAWWLIDYKANRGY